MDLHALVGSVNGKTNELEPVSSEVFLIRNEYCFFKRIQFHTEQVGLYGTVGKTLHERRNQRVFMDRIVRNTTR